jgi:hypothetical protein
MFGWHINLIKTVHLIIRGWKPRHPKVAHKLKTLSQTIQSINFNRTSNMTSSMICDRSTAIPFPTWVGRANGRKTARMGLKILSKKLNVFRWLPVSRSL